MDGGTPAAAGSVVSFRCSACGKCCNTPPALTVPELFHHERLFVGCLSVRRLPRHRLGGRLTAGDAVHELSAADVEQADRLAGELLFEPRLASQRGFGAQPPRFALATQGLDYPSLGACPARLADGRCGIHDDRKPGICGSVPLDPLQPDRLQHVVLLHRRAEAAYLGADCIAAGRRDGHAALTAGGEVVDVDYRGHLGRQRRALAAEKATWGDAVFALLERDLLADEAQARRAPADGYLTLSLVPVLAVLATRSAACRARCARYATSQIALIDHKVGQALRRRREQDRAVTRELRAFSQAYERFVAATGRSSVEPAVPDPVAAAADAYLGAGETENTLPERAVLA